MPAQEPAKNTLKAERDVRKRGAMSSEQRQKIRERRMKMIAARKAEMAAKALEVVKKYVPDEAQAKALLAELETTMRPHRKRERPPEPPKAEPPAPEAAK